MKAFRNGGTLFLCADAGGEQRGSALFMFAASLTDGGKTRADAGKIWICRMKSAAGMVHAEKDV